MKKGEMIEFSKLIQKGNKTFIQINGKLTEVSLKGNIKPGTKLIVFKTGEDQIILKPYESILKDNDSIDFLI